MNRLPDIAPTSSILPPPLSTLSFTCKKNLLALNFYSAVKMQLKSLQICTKVPDFELAVLDGGLHQEIQPHSGEKDKISFSILLIMIQDADKL